MSRRISRKAKVSSKDSPIWSHLQNAEFEALKGNTEQRNFESSPSTKIRSRLRQRSLGIRYIIGPFSY